MRFIVKSDVHQEYWTCDAPEIARVAHSREVLFEILDEIEQLQSQGYFVATCLSYEAAQALDESLSTHAASDFPLLIMLASRDVQRGKLPVVANTLTATQKPRISQADYDAGYQKLVDLIYAGDLYQANYSFRSDVAGIADGYELFCQLESEHPAPYAAFIEFQDWQIVSLSPELFLKKEGQTIISEPMKGTAPRGLWYEQDEEQKAWLLNDKKNRAENLMIVDLMRNDLGRVCEPHSISVPQLFAAKRFASLFQMVSEVQGTLKPDVTLIDILKATYPAGSITGAPKVRAMEVIKALETDCRSAYTGSLGIFLPNGDFRLNVAIRTLTVQNDLEGNPSPNSSMNSRAVLGIGSGVVSHSTGVAEWHECLLKGQFLNHRSRHNEVFETLLWSGEYHWLEDHIQRLLNSCEYFMIQLCAKQIHDALQTTAASFVAQGSHQNFRVRLAVDRQGSIDIKSQSLEFIGWGSAPIKLSIAKQRVDQASQYQYHKTDHRQHYDDAYAHAVANNFSEALFFNRKDELAEGAISNVLVNLAGQWLTPPRSSGVLDGIWRRYAIEELAVVEKPITYDMLMACDQIIIGNSVRLETQVSEVCDNNRVIWTSEG